MAASQSTTIPRARGMRVHPPATPPRASLVDHAPQLSPQPHTQTLGEIIDAIGFIETACAALEHNDKTAFVTPFLQHGISILRRAHDFLERADEMAPLRSVRMRTRARRDRRNAP